MEREKGAGIKLWELTDGIREMAQQFIPERKREEGRAYQRKPGGGRKLLPPRQVLAAIFFVLRIGIQWKALPKKFGAVSSVHEYFSEWAQAGLFMRLWQEGLLSYDELHGKGSFSPGSSGKKPRRPGEKRDETQPCGRHNRQRGQQA